MKALSFDDITLVPRFNNIPSRQNVDTSVQFGNFTMRIPVFSSNMDTITGSRMSQEMYRLGGMGFLHRFCSVEENVQLYRLGTMDAEDPGEAVVSLGVGDNGMKRFYALYGAGARYFCVDIAHGHSEATGQMIKAMKNAYSDIFVVAGNVCTSAGAEYLAACGADAVKVGIGPGSACSTRIKTGFGVPQFTAIQDCSRINCFIVADGGIRNPGDAVKALAAGANAVMLGGMLSGCDETPGKVIERTVYWDDPRTYNTNSEGKMVSRRYKTFRGMASKEAQDEFMGSMSNWKAAEGACMTVEAKGPVETVIKDMMGGIRSGMTYCGANSLEQIRQRATWVEISAAGAAEGRPHGVGRL